MMDSLEMHEVYEPVLQTHFHNVPPAPLQLVHETGEQATKEALKAHREAACFQCNGSRCVLVADDVVDCVDAAPSTVLVDAGNQNLGQVHCCDGIGEGRP